MELNPFQEALKKFITDSGLTQQQLAKRSNTGHSSVNRWIKGHSLPRRSTAEALDKALEADGELVKVWRVQATGSPLPEWARDIYAIEEASARLSVATPSLVPGYLQCRSYASWIIRTVNSTYSEEHLHRVVTHRVERLEQLPDLRVRAVFPLAAVANAPGTVRAEQARHLVDWIDNGRVAVHLVPDGILLPAPVAPLMVFNLRSGDDVAMSDHVTGSVALESHDLAAEVLNAALSDALPAAMSRTELKELAT